MAVNWLKGLVAPAAQFVGSPQGMPGAGQPVPDGPPPGGQPYAGQSYGAQPPMQPGMQQGMPQGVQGTGGGILDPMQWQTGTRTQGSASGQTGGGVAALEARCAELSNDVASLALFARTLLTLLEDAKVITRDQFMETKNRLDALDGKIDDR
jgi:hypothetical protein